VVAPLALGAVQRDAVLARIGASAPARLDADALGDLHEQFAAAVPFENLDIHLGRPIVLDLDRIVAKFVDERRGGFCFEMNTVFGALIASFGVPVDLLEGRVYGSGDPSVRFDHLCLRVMLTEPYLADVGFGACFRRPLRLADGRNQTDANGIYRIDDRADDTTAGDAWFDLVENGKPVYRFSSTARSLAEFEPGCRYHQSSPDSHFTANSLCTRPTPTGRVTISGRLLIERVDGVRTERLIEDDAELLALYADRFGVVLERLPAR
jgi:N-hydroxyarylamine O-acetyltransferase